MSWQSVLKSFIVGSERSPLPERDLESLCLMPSPDQPQATLEALSAANLLRKAGFVLPEFPISSFPISDEETPPVCSAAAVKDLNLMLSGRYADALPEFLDVLTLKNLRLPPELLPDLLEKAGRDAAFAEKIRPALGPCGEWLARQNPRWSSVLTGEEADWFTATFAERKRLLAATRARNPLLALAWLEKTWPEEKADHKVQFLDILHIRLSVADEDLLEKALSDKNRELRRAALRALMSLPESRLFSEANNFFREKLSGFFHQKNKPAADAFLKKSMPDLSEESLQFWLALLAKDALADWRNELVRLFIRLLPSADLPSLTGLSREKLLDSLHDTKDAMALLEAIVRQNDGSWTQAVLQHFGRDFRHAIWQSKEMTSFLTLFAPATMAFFQKNNFALGYDNQTVLRALENFRHRWPKSMLDNLLEQYRRPAYGSGEIPGWHYASALQNAAYHCHPPDATGSAFVRDYLQHPPKARSREFEAFLEIIRFRLNMQGHLQ